MRLRLIFGPVVLFGAATCSMQGVEHSADVASHEAKVSRIPQSAPPLSTNGNVFATNDSKVTGVKSSFFTILDKPYIVSGHAAFCARNKPDCVAPISGNVYLPVTKKLLDILNTVNRSVNERIKPMADNDQYGGEFWTVPEPREDGSIRGDCDDYTMTKRRILESVLPKESMSVAFLDIYKKGVYENSHAVLVVHTLNGDYVLDNLTDDLKFPGDNPSYVFRGITDPHNQGKWWKVDVRDSSEFMSNRHYLASTLKHGAFSSGIMGLRGADDFKVALLADPKPNLLMKTQTPRAMSVQFAFAFPQAAPTQP